MPTDPPEAAPPKRKRRWFQFSLRALMIVVALLAIVCAGSKHLADAISDAREAARNTPVPVNRFGNGRWVWHP
jgi:hypothetical protein